MNTDTADVVAHAALAIGHCQVQPGCDEGNVHARSWSCPCATGAWEFTACPLPRVLLRLCHQLPEGALVEGALRRLSIALCKGNDFLFRGNLHAFYHTAGKRPTRGAAVPHTIEL